MKKSILLMVLTALVALCFAFASCDSGSSDSSDPTPPPEPAPVTYTVSFNANGGTGTMDDAIVEKGVAYTVPTNGFTAPKIPVGAVNEGADIPFKCWKDGSGTEYAAGTLIPVSTDITLYAQWAKPLFSVSATKKVYFSKGNLQATIDATGVPTAWKFAENQFDCIGANKANTTIGSQEGTVDLFGWSTDGGTTPSANYKPWGINTSTNNSDYSGDFKDWGSIESLPGNNSTTKVWRTLTKDEWVYLFNTRNVNEDTGEGYSYQRAKINSDATGGGVYGMILYPDDYTEQTTATGGYTSAEWLAMEKAGCVFLPAAGFRDGSDVSGVGSGGYYWSATAGGSRYAYYLLFGSSRAGMDDYDRDYGRSVRLVCGEN